MTLLVLLDDGDILEKDDEINYKLSSEWKKIPENWIGNKLTYDDTTTLGRQKLPIRRKIKVETRYGYQVTQDCKCLIIK